MEKIGEIIKRCYNWFIVPKVGKRYNFFDDGKIYPNRHYFAECIKVISPNEAKETIVTIDNNDKTSLFDIWLENVHDSGWLYNETTDYYVCCRVENYDDNDIWFVRAKDNRWFSINIQSDWQCGLLDVKNEYKKVLSYE